MTLGFGTMSLTTSSDCVRTISTTNQKEVNVVKIVEGITYSCPWNKCCESPITAVERDLVQRGLPVTTNYIIKSTTNTSAIYTIY